MTARTFLFHQHRRIAPSAMWLLLAIGGARASTYHFVAPPADSTISPMTIFSGASVNGISGVGDPTTNWNVVNFPNQNDFFNDQQTGIPTTDIVGDTGSNPGMYSAFDGSNVYYRVRLGATNTTGGQNGVPSWNRVLWIGVDANGDGKIDMFIGVDNSGSTGAIEFRAPGTGANDGPSTTSISNNITASIAETATSFNYDFVSNLQPSPVNSDLDADGNPDGFISIRIPFFGTSGSATMQGALLAIAGINVTGTGNLRYIVATSTQNNSINEDIGSLNNIPNSGTWISLGALSAPEIAPEPATIFGIASGCALLLVLRTRRSRRS